ncbi:MAG: hypothetical protein J7K73_01130 [Nanoarchaeota archaeon]|nr:hypothetical protein [Nanoarchaeota archaeon]
MARNLIFSAYQMNKLEKEKPTTLGDIAEIATKVEPKEEERLPMILNKDVFSVPSFREVFEEYAYDGVVLTGEEGDKRMYHAREPVHKELRKSLEEILVNGASGSKLMVGVEIKGPFATKFVSDLRKQAVKKKKVLAKEYKKDPSKVKLKDYLNYMGWELKKIQNGVKLQIPASDLEAMSPEQKTKIFMSNYFKDDETITFEGRETAVLALTQGIYNQLKENLEKLDDEEKQLLETLLVEKDIGTVDPNTGQVTGREINYYLKLEYVAQLPVNPQTNTPTVDIEQGTPKEVYDALLKLAEIGVLDDAISKRAGVKFSISKSLPYANEIKRNLEASGLSVTESSKDYTVDTDFFKVKKAVSGVVSNAFPTEKEKVQLVEFSIDDKEEYMKKHKKGRLVGLLTEVAGWLGVGALFASYFAPAIVPPATEKTTHVPSLEHAVDGHNVTVDGYNLEVPDQTIQLTLPNGTIEVPAFEMLNHGYNLVVPQHNISLEDALNITGIINESKVSVYNYPSGAQVTENSTSNGTFDATLPTLVLVGDSYVLHVPDTNSTVGGFTAIYTPNTDAQGRILSYEISVEKHNETVAPYNITTPAHDETSETYIPKEWFGIGGVIGAAITGLFHGKRRAKNKKEDMTLKKKYDIAMAKIESLPKY